MTEKLCICGCGEQAVYAEAHCDRKFGARITRTDYEPMDCGYETSCWIWKGRLVRRYRSTTSRGKSVYAHRAMYEQEVGPIPAGLVLDHLCGVRCCIRPNHLEAVTQRTNQRRGSAKLTPEAVRQIHESTEDAVTLALRFGVTRGTIYSVRNGSSWGDLRPHQPVHPARQRSARTAT